MESCVAGFFYTGYGMLSLGCNELWVTVLKNVMNMSVVRDSSSSVLSSMSSKWSYNSHSQMMKAVHQCIICWSGVSSYPAGRVAMHGNALYSAGQITMHILLDREQCIVFCWLSGNVFHSAGQKALYCVLLVRWQHVSCWSRGNVLCSAGQLTMYLVL